MSTLYLVATPIGNLEDITLRALRILGEVGILACEDTRVTRKIFARHEIVTPRTLFSYHEHNEAQAGARIVGFLDAGQDVALCTDGGYPGISDPGYRLIRDAVAAGHRIDVIPGASAVPVALLVSGLPTSSYTFKGFPPRKPGPRRRFFEIDAEQPHTLVVFESPHRVAQCLRSALEALGNRNAAVCVELTKKFEEVQRGSLSELADAFEGKTIRGEVTIVIDAERTRRVAPAEQDES